MGEMVDRVKAAIKLNIENAQIGKDGRVFDKCELAARAAIEELRQITEDMECAAIDAVPLLEGKEARWSWEAMIDEALKE